MRRSIAVLSLAALLTACQPATVDKADASKAGMNGAAACPDQGKRMPLTGVCASAETRYFPADGPPPAAPLETCVWTPVEVTTPDPNEVFLANVSKCSGVASELEFSGGARSASIMVMRSAVFPAPAGQQFEPIEVARVFRVTEGQDPKAYIRDLARQSIPDKLAAARCDVREASADDTGMPKGALFVDEAASPQSKKAPSDGPESYTACGDWGVKDGVYYWLVRGPYAIYIALGQDLPDIDPATLTLLRKGADGAWAPAP